MDFKILNLYPSGLKNNITYLFHASYTSLTLFNVKTGPWIAGGAARLLLEGKSDIHDSDIDVFFNSEKQMSQFIEEWKNNLNRKINWFRDTAPPKIVSEKETVFSKTYEVEYLNKIYKVQLINKFKFNDINDMFAHFDYSVTCFATDLSKIITTQQALYDLNHKILRLGENNYVSVNTLKRLPKYMSYGFKPALGLVPTLVEKHDALKEQNFNCEWEDYNV